MPPDRARLLCRAGLRLGASQNVGKSNPKQNLDSFIGYTELLSRGVSISLNSDDPAQFGSGWLTQTLVEAQSAGGLSLETMTSFMRNGFLAAWLPESEKARYLERFDEADRKLKVEIEIST